MKDFLIARAYFAGWFIVRRISEKSAEKLFARLGTSMFSKNGKSVQRLRTNLARVMPAMNEVELDDLTRRGVLSYMRYWKETFRSPDWSKERILSTVTVSNEHLLMDPFEIAPVLLSVSRTLGIGITQVHISVAEVLN